MHEGLIIYSKIPAGEPSRRKTARCRPFPQLAGMKGKRWEGLPCASGLLEFSPGRRNKRGIKRIFSSCIFHIVAYAARSTLPCVADRNPRWVILLKGFRADALSARLLAPGEVKEGAAFATSLQSQRAARNGRGEKTLCGRN